MIELLYYNPETDKIKSGTGEKPLSAYQEKFGTELNGYPGYYLKQAIETYTMPEIKALWKRYTNTTVLRRLVAGKWEFIHLKKGQTLPQMGNTTRAEVVSIQKEMGFPEFIEKHAR